MTAEYIYKCAKAVKDVFKTDEPTQIFRMRGVEIKSTALPALCGMICVADGKTAVFDGIGSEGAGRRVLLAKLLGHAVLHRERLLCGESFEYVKGMTGDLSSDREVGIFAAELLISDEKITELREFGFTDGQIVMSLGELRGIAVLKLFSMRCRQDGGVSNTLTKSDVALFARYEV